jgi:hypothetical protein
MFNSTLKGAKMEKYFGKFNGINFTVSPTVNRTENNEVKCQVSWDDGCTDFIWFTETEDNLVCQLNPKIAVNKNQVKVLVEGMNTQGEVGAFVYKFNNPTKLSKFLKQNPNALVLNSEGLLWVKKIVEAAE